MYYLLLRACSHAAFTAKLYSCSRNPKSNTHEQGLWVHSQVSVVVRFSVKFCDAVTGKTCKINVFHLNRLCSQYPYRMTTVLICGSQSHHIPLIISLGAWTCLPYYNERRSLSSAPASHYYTTPLYILYSPEFYSSALGTAGTETPTRKRVPDAATHLCASDETLIARPRQLNRTRMRAADVWNAQGTRTEQPSADWID